MAVTEAKILTAETVPAYLEDHLDKLQDVFATKGNNNNNNKLLFKATNILGGNVNYAFCVTEQTSSRTIFLKQAPEFVAIFGPDGFALSSERMRHEMDVYAEWNQLLGPELSQTYLPKIYFFDSKFALNFCCGGRSWTFCFNLVLSNFITLVASISHQCIHSNFANASLTIHRNTHGGRYGIFGRL